MAEPPDDTRNTESRRAVLAGLGLLAFCIVLALLPLVWGSSSINKYFVAFGLLGSCVAISFIIHGAWDWWRGRRG